jgi:hypothetical protein
MKSTAVLVLCPTSYVEKFSGQITLQHWGPHKGVGCCTLYAVCCMLYPRSSAYNPDLQCYKCEDLSRYDLFQRSFNDRYLLWGIVFSYYEIFIHNHLLFSTADPLLAFYVDVVHEYSKIKVCEQKFAPIAGLKTRNKG